jgi:hypothetical protein
VERPDGQVQELVPSTENGVIVTYSATELPGVYTVTPVLAAEPTPDPSAPSPRPSPTPNPSPSGSGVVAPAEDPSLPTKFVVALFDVRESTITPGAARGLEALGAAPSSGPAASPVVGGAVTERPTTRDELWVPIILFVLLALCVEWAVYHRDALARIRRGLSNRLGRAPSGSA